MGDGVVPRWSSKKCEALNVVVDVDVGEDVNGSANSKSKTKSNSVSNPVDVREYAGVTHGGILWTKRVVGDFMAVMREYYEKNEYEYDVDSDGGGGGLHSEGHRVGVAVAVEKEDGDNTIVYE